MDSALLTARAACCGGCAAATGRMCSSRLWNKWNFHLFHLFHSSLLLDHGRWLRPLGVCRAAPREHSSRNSKSSTLRFSSFASFVGLPQPFGGLVHRCPRQSHKNHKRRNFAFCDFSFFFGSLRFVSAVLWILRSSGRPQPGSRPAVLHSPISLTLFWPRWPSLRSSGSMRSAELSYLSALGQIVSMIVGTGGFT
jgi:hypothetical protein